MYNHFLKTFIAVAETGSFTKAADIVYLTPPAVMKQINSLEAELGLKLIDRTHSGAALTKAGKVIYNDAKFIIGYAERSIKDAKLAESGGNTFRVGTSILNPARPFMDIWYRVCPEFPDSKLHLVPFDDDNENILSVIEKLGTSFDFLVGVCDSAGWVRRASFIPLGYYRKMIAVPKKHRLASKRMLTIEDLKGETVMMVKRGDSPANDRLRDDLAAIGVNIEDTSQYYDMTVFNKAAESDRLLLNTECWTEVHPGLITIPVEWDYRITYGLLYSQNPSEQVARFAEAVTRLC